MPPNIGSMTKPNRPPAVSGPAAEGSGAQTVGRVAKEPCADETMKQGSSPIANPAGVAGVGSQVIGAMAQGPGILQSMSDVKPTSKAKPAPTGGPGNTGVGDIGARPKAGDGPGTGQVTKPGIRGKTAAKPRSSFGSGGYGGSK
jgi:hypothetical protein